MTTAVLVLDNITIKTDSEGRFCLNDLHKASGGDQKHRPKYWTLLAETQALILEIAKGGITPLVSIHGGAHRGTYVCKELVYAYAMWISPAFHLKVIRAYDRMATQGVAVHENAAEALLRDPLKFIEIAVAQAKQYLAERDAAVAAKVAAEEKVAIAAPKAEVFDAVVADKNTTLAAFVRTLEGVNSNAVKGDLRFCRQAPRM